MERIISELVTERNRLFAQATQLQQAIDVLAPPVPVVAKPSEAQHRERILEAIGNDWKGKRQIAKETGIYAAVCTRILDRMHSKGELERQRMNGVTHYRHIPEEMRIIAGEGVVG